MATIKKQIIAMGGGGFLMEPENPLLDQYILDQSPQKKPKICFLATAGGDCQARIDLFYESFNRLNCTPTHLSLFKPPLGDLETFVLNQDVLYVGGGNTKNLLALWREWGLDQIMKKAWNQGIVLSGVSAGSICWFEEGVTDSIPGPLTALRCLGFLKGSNCPHYDGEVERRPSYHRLMSSGLLQSGYAADDGVALHFINEKPEAIVSSRPAAYAYEVSASENQVTEEILLPRFLGCVVCDLYLFCDVVQPLVVYF